MASASLACKSAPLLLLAVVCAALPPAALGQTCTTGLTFCLKTAVSAAGCKNLKTDMLNCGTCGFICQPGQKCCGGICKDTMVDVNNCGSCGFVCSATGSWCSFGKCSCVQSSTGNVQICSGKCVDLYKDPTNCASCGNVCPTNVPCTFGKCKCPSVTQTICPVSGCVDLQFDPANCGACGNKCASGQKCSMFKCQQATLVQ